ncbi:ABC transporter ATP-binding protein [Microbacterium sp. BK668]|uniref:ABC transporter ATP-binding protein n=1 Tax=Microbacterium sp. BK668 TaxID=2512118 RepID=UPI0010607761|nr:ABC transporter ATP-binding protein [Microbacterium sp. BK668]TDN91460.1 peptide/nickel transport system ATP-binding protein/peptide/nickel transport system ATP-binding protein [Microbacterium sp. BK668]
MSVETIITEAASAEPASIPAGERPPVLQVRGLSVDYTSSSGPAAHAVRDVSFDIGDGEFVGLLGESGCGKSTLGNAILRLLDKPARHAGGEVVFGGRSLYGLAENDLAKLRWRELSTVFQSSMNSLNPVLRVVAQFEDVMRAHDWDDATEGDRHDRIADVLRSVDLDPERVMRAYPHELSGGMRQRVALALALVLRPRLVVLDEPTTGLDVIVQRQIVNVLRSLQAEQGFSVLFISHDLGTVLELSDRVLVMYAGEIVEQRAALDIAKDPLHPYTRGLLGSFDDPRAEQVSVAYIAGRPPALTLLSAGCPFAARCPSAMDICRSVDPPVTPVGSDADAGEIVRCHLFDEDTTEPGRAAEVSFSRLTAWSDERRPVEDASPIVVLDSVSKTYHRREGMRRVPVEAVQDASFALIPGQVRALVGQSGSGKSTIAKMITGTEHCTSGTITVGGKDATRLRGRALARHRADVQMVFQDPFSALNPTTTIGHALSRPLRNHLGLRGRAVAQRSAELLESVGLSPGESYLDKLPHQLSGGQRQRVVIARAMAPEPRVLIADEPISMLDVSIRAEILELLADMVRRHDMAMLYITHDLLSARLLADRTMVMHRGRIVEDGETQEVVLRPKEEYTRLLLDAIPNPFAERV